MGRGIGDGGKQPVHERGWIEESIVLKSLDSGLPDCVAISQTANIRLFVIPGLTRNPLFFQRPTLLDAGSSPA